MGLVNAIKRVNFAIIIGICIVLLLTAVSFYPERFATSDPYGKEVFEYDNVNATFLIPPVPPGDIYKWGTDEKGRDLRSLIIYGTRATLAMALSVAIGRLIIALPLAITAAYKSKLANQVIKFFHIVFSAFPIIAIILILNQLQLFTDIFSNPMSAATFIMVTFGWGKLAKMLTKTVEEVLNQDFIEGEIAIGKTKWDIAIQNVLPHIVPSMVVLVFLEVAVVLLLLSQVGVLGLVLSGNYSNLDVPYEFDWASLLVYSHYLFGTYKTWLIFYPAAAFAVSIIGFNLLGEGIRIEFEKRDSRIISVLKKIPRHLSPMRLIYEIRNFSIYKRSVCIKTGILCAALIVAFFPHPESKVRFDSLEAFSMVNDFANSEFKYREYKKGKNVIVMDYIAEKLQQYGVQPYDNRYIHEMVTQEIPEIAKANISYKTDAGNVTQLVYKQDYILAEPVAASGEFDLEKLDAKQLNDSSWLFNAGDKYKDKVLLIDAKGMEYREFNSILNDVRNFIKPKGVIFIEDWNSVEGRGDRTIYVTGMSDIFSVLISSDKGEALLKQKKITLSVQVDVRIIKNVLYANVIGIIPGKDPVLKNDIIMIGSSLNDVMSNMGKGTHEALKTGGVATQLELARMLAEASAKPDRTVIFAFWDDSIKSNKGAKVFSDQYIDRSKNNIFYIDIGNLDGDKLLVDSSGIKPKNKKGQGYVRELKANLVRNDIDAVFRSISNSSIDSFTSSKQEVLAFDSANKKYVVETKKKQKTAQVTREDLVKFNKIGQMIIDTVFDIIYDEGKN